MRDYNIASSQIQIDEDSTWQTFTQKEGPLCLSSQNIGLQWSYTLNTYGL